MATDDSRIRIELDEEMSARLARLAEQAHTDGAEFARSLLEDAMSFYELDGLEMTELLNGIPGALERARLGYAQGLSGESVPLSDI